VALLNLVDHVRPDFLVGRQWQGDVG
jgi:hypothetical protein